MSTQDEDFLNALRATFAIEAAEHLHAMASGLLELEKSPATQTRRGLVDAIFRAAHSLKGAARAVDLTGIESHCQSLETMFADWKRQDASPEPEVLDTAHRILDDITAVLGVPAAPPASAPPAAAKPAAAEGTVRIAVGKLDARVLDAEEMLAAKLTAAQRAEDVRALATRFEAWRKAWTAVEPDVRALRQAVDRPAAGAGGQAPQGLGRLLQFLDDNLDHVAVLEDDVAALGRRANHDRQMIGKLVDDLLEESKKLLLLPFATLAAPFPKLVRDLCRDEGKEAELVIRGEDVEVDKRILEEMKDPLIHLLRNAIDHGIEAPAARRRSGKPSAATITIALSPVNGNKVELLVSDDGAGIDTEKVRQSGVARGALSPEEARELGDRDAHRLIFEPEVSASPIITRLSGRGLGLAIVRERVEKLGGTVSVESRAREGTRFSIVIPSTLATFRGVLVETAGRLFVVPTFHVERVVRVMAGEIRTVEGRETISLGGQAVAFARLADVLALPPAAADGDEQAATMALVLGTGDHRMAFAVDAVRDEQEVLVKPLRPPLSRVRHIAGATVLGDGRVAPILNVTDVLKSAKTAGRAAVRADARARPAESVAKSVLVAEDSITSRMLIKGILESAGYRVKTAVDGMEAFTMLRAERFDVLVSDVEMPRLNGFDLTARIRADRKLAELPVVLVTALETREDRERGIDVGASAYIIKSSFDQGNLLDAVRRLV